MADFTRQTGWKAETTWDGDLPTPSRVWLMLTGGGLPGVFREMVRDRVSASKLLRAGLVQSLASDGLTTDEISAEVANLTGKKPAARTIERLLVTQTERAEWKVAFTNLVSGRFTELVFERTFGERLMTSGLTFVEETAQRNFVDYRIQAPAEGFELAINLKNAGVQMRESKRWFGLDPEDTLPIATYKIFGSETAGIPHLVYVYLVDWTLLDRLRNAYWSSLLDAERDAFRLLASVKGLPRDVEDAFILGTVADRLDRLMEEVGYDAGDLSSLPFRAITAAKCRRLFYDNHRRSPYVYLRKMNTDPNVHISVSTETMAFSDFVDAYLATSEGRGRLREELNRTWQVTIPAPRI